MARLFLGAYPTMVPIPNAEIGVQGGKELRIMRGWEIKNGVWTLLPAGPLAGVPMRLFMCSI